MAAAYGSYGTWAGSRMQRTWLGDAQRCANTENQASRSNKSALRCWNCCSYMSFVLIISDYVYLWNRKFKGFAVVCDLFWKPCVPLLFLSWLRNTVSLLNLFWKCMGMKRDALLRLYGWHSAKRRLFCAELLCHAPASGRNRSPACFCFFFSRRFRMAGAVTDSANSQSDWDWTPSAPEPRWERRRCGVRAHPR